MPEPIAYLNGQLVPVSQAQLHVFDLGIVGGVAVSEMARTFRHQIFRLDEHLARLQHSLEVVSFAIDLSMDELKSVCHKIVEKNAALIERENDLGLIVFVTGGLNTTYVGKSAGSTRQHSIGVHTFPLHFELWAEKYESGLHLVTVNVKSIPDQTIDSSIKHRSRMHWHVAAQQAHRIDPAAMAILTDGEGQLTETASGNLCIVDGQTLITPAVHVLRGISCDYVGELAAEMGLGFVRGPVAVDDLAHADEAILTSTPNCLLPVTQFNGSPIGSGRPGPIFHRLIEAWSRHVGLDIAGQMRRGLHADK